MNPTQSSTTASADHGIVRPATSRDIVYRAFGRPYAGGPGQVISLFASCSYPTGGWEIFFTGNGQGGYNLMEKVPGIAPQIISYYAASFTTGVGLATPVKFVEITDAHGTHRVPVEMIG